MSDTGVYFIQRGDDGPIKIGVSRTSISKRLSGLQIGSDAQLNLLAILSDCKSEKGLHQRFASAHIRGEWFHPSPELLAFVAEVNGGASPKVVRIKPPLVETRGSRLLKSIVSPPPPEWPKRRLAKQLGVTHQAVWHWLVGRAKPDLTKRKQISELLGVPVDAWDDAVTAGEEVAA